MICAFNCGGMIDLSKVHTRYLAANRNGDAINFYSMERTSASLEALALYLSYDQQFSSMLTISDDCQLEEKCLIVARDECRDFIRPWSHRRHRGQK